MTLYDAVIVLVVWLANVFLVVWWSDQDAGGPQPRRLGHAWQTVLQWNGDTCLGYCMLRTPEYYTRRVIEVSWASKVCVHLLCILVMEDATVYLLANYYFD